MMIVFSRVELIQSRTARDSSRVLVTLFPIATTASAGTPSLRSTFRFRPSSPESSEFDRLRIRTTVGAYPARTSCAAVTARKGTLPPSTTIASAFCNGSDTTHKSVIARSSGSRFSHKAAKAIANALATARSARSLPRNYQLYRLMHVFRSRQRSCVPYA